MLKFKVLETNSNESELLFRLISRGKRTDIQDYFSVDRYDLEKGWVAFIRLNCKPETIFKVGVAGYTLIVSVKQEDELKAWLKEWGFEFEEKGVLEVSTPTEASAYLSHIHEKTMGQKKRKEMLHDLETRIWFHEKKETII
jgi:hypothetical protein